jgi:UDP:flavonoid glycosyltransferase YjiC (YdhE family)
VVYVSRVARSAGFQDALAECLQQIPGARLLINIREEESLPALRSQSMVRFVESVPHQWLFSRVAFAIHHAGAGTAAAVLRAGLPSLAVPTWGDQTLWAQRIHDLGAGPRPIHVRWITAKNLGRSIREGLANPSLRHHAQAVSRQLAAEDGLGSAVAQLRSLVSSSARNAAVGRLPEGGLHGAIGADDLRRPEKADRQSYA